MIFIFTSRNSTLCVFDKRAKELKTMLKNRGYKLNKINTHIESVHKLERSKLLVKRTKPPTNKITLIFPFYPQMKSISNVIHQQKREIMKDASLKRAFGDGFQVAYTRDKNLSDMLCKSKLRPKPPGFQDNKSDVHGWWPCKKCTSCKHSSPEVTYIRIHHKDDYINIRNKITCLTRNTIYIIECVRCLDQYAGSTCQPFRLRCDQWRSDININKKSGDVIQHFNMKGHDISTHFRMTPIEIVYGDEDTLRIRERMYIDTYGLLESGMNTKRTT